MINIDNFNLNDFFSKNGGNTNKKNNNKGVVSKFT